MYKYCSNCKNFTSLNDFHKLKNGKFGKNSVCKLCRKNISKDKNYTFDILKNYNCPNCNTIKNAKDFYKNKKNLNGLQSICKTCQKLRIANSMSKLKNYSKVILKKFINKNKSLKINLNYEDLIKKFKEQNGLCVLTKHKLEHKVDLKQRTDNIWNFSIYINNNLNKNIINYHDFNLIINLIYTMQNLYKINIQKSLQIYKELKNE